MLAVMVGNLALSTTTMPLIEDVPCLPFPEPFSGEMSESDNMKEYN